MKIRRQIILINSLCGAKWFFDIELWRGGGGGECKISAAAMMWFARALCMRASEQMRGYMRARESIGNFPF
jgi:hypothetical protein